MKDTLRVTAYGAAVLFIGILTALIPGVWIAPCIYMVTHAWPSSISLILWSLVTGVLFWSLLIGCYFLGSWASREFGSDREDQD